MRTSSIFKAAAAAVSLGLALGAAASPVAHDFSFVLGGFVDINGSPALPSPVSQITGSFTVTFDTALNYDNDTADVVVHMLTGVTVDSPIGFTYDAASHTFFLGGTANDSNFVVVGTNDFVLTYNLTDIANPAFIPCDTPGFLCGANTGNPAYDTSGFTTTGNDSLWFIAAAQSNPNGTSVPEPATGALVLAAMLGLALSRQKSRR
ncbi:PEP-CTERM sorting domain-containing protein [Pelomonas sp. KK5]|uniref:PEP-CTERM sorting domain-containing protein n=1 Tax=Pelomonas sp. KK5 TaxID=1855730 RepID=UPI00097C0586|nr:PEP-CTERM sorting domain-containing protein [Pelomonas sp. KK5]